MRVMVAMMIMAFTMNGIVGCNGSASSCVEVERRVLADDERSPEGMSAADVMSLIDSPHTDVLTWHEGVTNAPDASETTIDIVVERADSPVSYVVTRKEGHTREELQCGAAIHVPAHVYVTTSDGALGDAFPVELVYEMWRRDAGMESVWGLEEFAFEALGGWLEPVQSSAVGEIHVEFAPMPRGTIAVKRFEDSQGNAGEAFSVAAHWGPYVRVSTAHEL